jgi:hypothetical protein
MVQRQLAHVVASLAQKEPWPELLNSLPEMGTADDARIKQLCFFLIDKLAGECTASLAPTDPAPTHSPPSPPDCQNTSDSIFWSTWKWSGRSSLQSWTVALNDTLTICPQSSHRGAPSSRCCTRFLITTCTWHGWALLEASSLSSQHTQFDCLKRGLLCVCELLLVSLEGHPHLTRHGSQSHSRRREQPV